MSSMKADLTEGISQAAQGALPPETNIDREVVRKRLIRFFTKGLMFLSLFVLLASFLGALLADMVARHSGKGK